MRSDRPRSENERLNSWEADLSVRCAGPALAPDLVRIELNFAIPIFLSRDHELRLAQLMEEITQAPINQPTQGVHWVAFNGCKLNFSDRDSALLGRSPSGAADLPAAGEEPTCQENVYCIETSARGFVSTRERDREQANRAYRWCPTCEGTHQIRSAETLDGFTHCPDCSGPKKAPNQ